MPNPFGKSRPVERPYAIYAGPMGFEWRILKTRQLAKNEGPYSMWWVAAKSEATFGSLEYGDTYKRDVVSCGRLVAADPAWLEVYDIRPGVPTPAEYLEAVS